MKPELKPTGKVYDAAASTTGTPRPVVTTQADDDVAEDEESLPVTDSEPVDESEITDQYAPVTLTEAFALLHQRQNAYDAAVIPLSAFVGPEKRAKAIKAKQRLYRQLEEIKRFVFDLQQMPAAPEINANHMAQMELHRKRNDADKPNRIQALADKFPVVAELIKSKKTK
jgi:hypothetical protein